MYDFAGLAKAYGPAPVQGRFKSQNHDFQVEEIMPVRPCGQGEHLWLLVEKDGCNTEQVARQLAGLCGVGAGAVGYAGLKDKHALCTQWFSVHLPGRSDPAPASLEAARFRILHACRHRCKLKRGVLSGNRFRIRIRSLSGSVERLQQRLETIRQRGVPNYFGTQRFGFGMSNLHKAEALFSNQLSRCSRHQRSLYLSAARAWIFNRVLSERVRRHDWNKRLPGDVFSLDGSNSFFADDGSELDARLQAMDIHPTGPLWGAGDSPAAGQCLVLETRTVNEFPLLARGLVEAGLRQARRALRLRLRNMSWRIGADHHLLIEFELPAGGFATMVLREFLETGVPADGC